MTNCLIPNERMVSVQHLDGAAPTVRRLSAALEALTVAEAYFRSWPNHVRDRVKRKLRELDLRIAAHVEERPELIAPFCTLEERDRITVTADDDAVRESLEADDGYVSRGPNGRLLGWSRDGDDTPVRLDRVLILGRIHRLDP